MKKRREGRNGKAGQTRDNCNSSKALSTGPSERVRRERSGQPFWNGCCGDGPCCHLGPTWQCLRYRGSWQVGPNAPGACIAWRPLDQESGFRITKLQESRHELFGSSRRCGQFQLRNQTRGWSRDLLRVLDLTPKTAGVWARGKRVLPSCRHRGSRRITGAVAHVQPNIPGLGAGGDDIIALAARQGKALDGKQIFPMIDLDASMAALQTYDDSQHPECWVLPLSAKHVPSVSLLRVMLS